MWLAMMMSLFPVAVTKTSMNETTYSIVTTSYPSIHAYNAQIGSTSETYTLALLAFIAAAHPLPTSPYPNTNTFFPEIITSVALFNPSGNECLHP